MFNCCKNCQALGKLILANLSLQVVENVKENLQQNIYKTIIPRNVRLAEAPSYGQPITLYDPRSTGAEAYRLLAEEVINREVE